MDNNLFPVRLQLRIDWSDLDYFKHVNNVSFFRYIQSSRVNYWNQVGLTKSHMNTDIGPMLVSCKCDFKQPLFYPGEVMLLARVEFIKNTSFSISHRLLNFQNEIVAEALDVMVMYDFNKNEKILFPDWLKEKIKELENKKF
ncbi:MAG: acyl-CoA thioesterase [Flavobacteriales bacterium]